MHNTNFPPSIDPHTFSIIAVAVGYACVGDYNANEQNSIGINSNSKKAKKGGSPYTDNENHKSNQNQRNEIEFLLDALNKMQQELDKMRNS